jgi:peptidoglycan/xylan/chitin deacetylase (PgdA/CDA1 family)
MPSAQWMAARALSFVLYYSGGLWVYESLDRRAKRGPRCTVVNYHRVVSESPGYHDIAVAPETFRSHLTYMLRRGYRFLSLSQFHAYLGGEFTLEGNSILLTLDDGYRDNYASAFPVLRELGIPATVFLCTGPIETGKALWWDRAAQVVRSARANGSHPAEGHADVPDEARAMLHSASSGSDEHASAVIGSLIDWLKERPAAERESILEALEESAGPSTDAGLMLTWDMVREMRDAGIDFGAHSVTHPVFSDISPGEASAEILESKRTIEEHLGEEVTSFAYPYGKWGYFDDATVVALQTSGIGWAYTTENGVNAPGSDPYRLRRNGIRDIPHYFLAVRLAGVFESPAVMAVRSRLGRTR